MWRAEERRYRVTLGWVPVEGRLALHPILDHRQDAVYSDVTDDVDINPNGRQRGQEERCVLVVEAHDADVAQYVAPGPRPWP